MTSVLDASKSLDWAKDQQEPQYGLTSPWSHYYAPADTAPHGRFQGELDDVVVYGEIPKEINGTFYRMTIDPAVPPHPKNPFLEGDGNLTVFQFQDGRVHMKIKYVETERYLLERKAGKRLFGTYRNPFTNHPCVRMADDSTGNTNIVYWGGKLLALSERSLPYEMDPDTLETRGFDPFGGQVKAKTFSAHPKVDPFNNELVTFGYEAKGLGTPDICYYSIDPSGKVKDEAWFKEDQNGMPHDAWLTENWLILSSMPFKVNSDEDMKAGAHHWEFVPDRPSVFWLAPRKASTPRAADWKVGEVRKYTWNNGVIIHCGAAWEEEDGTLRLESHFVSFNVFFDFNPPGMTPPEIPTGDWVRWTMDPKQPSGARLADPEILMPYVCDFPKTDERFLTRKQKIVFLISCDAGKKATPGMFRFNSIVKLNTETKDMMVFAPAPDARVAEPVFVNRSKDAPEGDGWIICWTDRPSRPRGELVVLDTNDFSKPVAVVQLPFSSRIQVHGNWVDNPNPGQPLPRLTRPVKDIQPSIHGALDRID
ncbi:carotenoid oxygenase [Leptodontidium sp. 2 PMI_412]|nr:carotenoid oxygenase [Leptodontidium sp. 2 PMI_412]